MTDPEQDLDHMAASQTTSETSQPHLHFPSGTRRGVLMPIGGAEDKFDDKIILSTFTQLAGGDLARILIVPTASSIETAGLRYKAIFLSMGVESAEVAYIGSREDANSEELSALVKDATGIFLTGGNQMRLSAMIGGTRFEQEVREANESGVIVAGTSAGASILSAHMVALGASGGTPKLRMAQMVAGFGLISNVIIDQHFRQRDRIGRLLALVASNPGLLGIGIDEDTAAIIDEHGVIEVIGRHSLTIVDGSEIFSDIFQVKAYGEITVSNARLHLLTPGRRFDMKTRTLIAG
jgi:cyanophycinase